MFNTYFSANYILEKKALINIIFSDRSDGKSFDCKLRALQDYKKDKSITIYMRRYKSEITEKLYSSFFDEVTRLAKYKDEFKDWIFKGSKKGVQVKLPNSEVYDWIVLFVPLSMAGKLKSQISEVHRIHIIDYDEFIPLDARYLKDEVLLLLEFWKSIDRDRETTQLLILGNKVTPFNPVFDYFNIELSLTKDKIRLYNNDTIAVQIYSNREHREQREQGKFKQMIKGTPYEDYDNGGILKALNVSTKSHNGFDYMCSFKTAKGEGSIWYKNGAMVISEYERKDGFVITDAIYNTGRQEYMCTFGRFGNNFKSIYRRGDMYFESERSFYNFQDILIKCGSL